ncbi:MAG TPA: PAC2 family protein [Acidimicrobiales bacterium]|nr:PAC2 family protein [Acidimicrobiales bacterium]
MRIERLARWAAARRATRSPLVRLAARDVRRPVMVVAFSGWNDAGEAASTAVSFLSRSLGADRVGEIEAEEFFDFTVQRPEVLLGPSGERRIAWPATALRLARGAAGGRDLLLLSGPEPHLRWRAYCAAILELVRTLGVEAVVTLGAHLAEVTHSRAVPVTTTSSDSRLGRAGVAPARYEGPTGIVGVLGAELAAAGVPCISAWASVPCYGPPVSAKAALALVRTASELVGCEVDASDLEAEARAYERRMDELVARDENLAAYVARIEEMDELGAGDAFSQRLAEEIERFLEGRS